jgi:hypothetical protein
MAYFKHIPDIEYIDRTTDILNNYVVAKNIFKKLKVREDILNNVSFFEKYQIVGDDRPDNVAYDVYGDAEFDWIILLANNILNVQSEWPLTQQAFDNYLIDKYKTYDKIYEVHHYETIEITNRAGEILVPAGLTVPGDYSITYYDYLLDSETTITNVTIPITNYNIEDKREIEKRNIRILKNRYIPTIFEDIERLMPYKEGTVQYKSKFLKRCDNSKLTQ